MSTATETDASCPMTAEPQAEHRWLQKLVGEWVYEGEATMAPGQPPMAMGGVERVRSLGGLWTIGEGEMAMPDGGPGRTVMTLGFDPARARFVGTFVGSMMTHLWLYEGTLDADGRVLTLDAEGPSMLGESLAPYQDVIELVSDDHRILRSRTTGPDGEWVEFMTAHYRRRPGSTAAEGADSFEAVEADAA
jgi:hypothetical protein